MASSTSKKVLLRRFEREPLKGFVSPPSFLQSDGIELLSVNGSLSVVPYAEVKSVCFVKDLDTAESGPAPLLFQNRPKMEGLWVRLHFRDGEFMDGVMANNLLQLEPHGFSIVPPNAGPNLQYLFVPKTALVNIQVLGVVRSPLNRRKRPVPADQIKLFE